MNQPDTPQSSKQIWLWALLAILVVTTVGSGIMAFFLMKKPSVAGANGVSLDSTGITPIDLTAHYDNSTLFHRPGEWEAVPHGHQTFGGVPFEADGLIVLIGEGARKDKRRYRERVEGIAVGKKFERLHLLHTAHYPAEDETPYARVVLHYADGSTTSFQLVFGRHARDWWRRKNESVSALSDPNSKVVWRGDDAGRTPGNTRRLFKTTFENPKPGVEVAMIDLASENGTPNATIVAMSVGPAKLPAAKDDPPSLPEPDAAARVTRAATTSNLQDFSLTNVISIRLGDDEAGSGLTLVEPRDGRTAIESIDGVSARVAHLEPGSAEQYFCFQIDPTFKQEDVRRVRIDVEFLDPQPGFLSVHYDAMDTPGLSKPAYRDATPKLTLAGSNRWQLATFYTRNDALFSNRQNGKADFRVSAKAPVLYVRRVTVTREPVVESPMAELKFTAVDAESGQPVANVKLRISGDERSGSFRAPDVVTDAEGKCLVKHPGSNTVLLNVNVSGVDVTPTRVRWQTAREKIPSEYVFRVTRPLTIGGTVLNDIGQPLGGARISFRDYSFPNTPANPRETFLVHGSSTTTKANGSWEFRSLPPKFRDFSINVSHPDFVDARFITSGVGRGFSNMPMDKLTNRTAVIQLRRRGPTLDDAGKPILENILPNIAAGSGGIQNALPWWKELSSGRRDGIHDPAAPPGRPGCFGIAWGVKGHENAVVVFQTKQTVNFESGGWHVQVNPPANGQFSSEDMGRIMADWLVKTYGITSRMQVRVLN